MEYDPNDKTTPITNGVMTVEIPDIEVTKAGWDGIMENAITAKINEVFGVQSPKEIADHVMYCLPDHGPFWVAAKAYINSWNSVYNGEYCNYLSVQMHEIGHNLGYAHSGADGIMYEDETGMMGYSEEEDDEPIMCFNGAKSWQSGWYSSKNATVVPSATNGDECFEEEVYGIADYDNPDAKYAIVKIDDSGSTDYYVAFNKKSGINAGTKSAANQVTVTKSSLEGGYQGGKASSDLVATLDSGDEYSVIVDGKNVVIKVGNITDSSARVSISENGLGCKQQCDCPCASPKSAKKKVGLYVICT